MKTDKSIPGKSLSKILLVLAITSMLLVTGINCNTLLGNSNKAIAQQEEPQTNNDTIRVETGGGNATAPLTVFVPQRIEIKAGQTINWYNPTLVGEPHSVAFLQGNNSLFPPFSAPFAIPNSTELKALVQSPNLEPLIVPNPPGTEQTAKTVIIDNARNYNPTVIDSTGENVTYFPPNANITIVGTEKYVNSGWIYPEGQVPPGAPPITTFTVTFENPGTFDYLCTLHPWMTGSVEVTL